MNTVPKKEPEKNNLRVSSRGFNPHALLKSGLIKASALTVFFLLAYVIVGQFGQTAYLFSSANTAKNSAVEIIREKVFKQELLNIDDFPIVKLLSEAEIHDIFYEHFRRWRNKKSEDDPVSFEKNISFHMFNLWRGLCNTHNGLLKYAGQESHARLSWETIPFNGMGMPTYMHYQDIVDLPEARQPSEFIDFFNDRISTDESGKDQIGQFHFKLFSLDLQNDLFNDPDTRKRYLLLENIWNEASKEFQQFRKTHDMSEWDTYPNFATLLEAKYEFEKYVFERYLDYYKHVFGHTVEYYDNHLWQQYHGAGYTFPEIPQFSK